VDAARRSPVYQFVKVWKLALPHHPEWRTLPMLFYVPPLLPVAATYHRDHYDSAADFFSSLESARLPLRYMALLFSAGDEAAVAAVYRKLTAVRVYMRARTVGDIPEDAALRAVEEAGTTPREIEAIYHLSAIAGVEERFVIPPFLREEAIDASADVHVHQGEQGAGFLRPPKRGW
jgi:nitrate reductase beta subunit